MAVRLLEGLLSLLVVLVIVTMLWIQQISFSFLEDFPSYLWHPQRINLSIRSSGRLGNQMFEFASLVGVGLSNNISVVLPSGLSHLSRIFDMTECQFPTMSEEDMMQYYELRVPLSLGYDPMFKDIRQHIYHSKTIIKGFMQSFRYFEEHDDLLRSCFQFTKVFKQNMNNFFNTHVPKNRVTVGVHVRRGDFTWERHKLRGMSAAKASYFHKAMDLMQKKYPNAFFIVASDDMKWATANLGSRAKMTPFTNPFYDLGLLAGCQHSIISSGTFSWWAGWLANGTTIYYNNYPRNGSSLSAGLNRSDYYYKHWIPLGD